MFHRPEMPMRKFFDHLLGSEEEGNMFARWAFGDDYNTLENGLEFLKSWNALHKEFLLDPASPIALDAPKMIKLYRASKAT
jgi:hypothetical protein